MAHFKKARVQKDMIDVRMLECRQIQEGHCLRIPDREGIINKSRTRPRPVVQRPSINIVGKHIVKIRKTAKPMSPYPCSTPQPKDHESKKPTLLTRVNLTKPQEQSAVQDCVKRGNVESILKELVHVN